MVVVMAADASVAEIDHVVSVVQEAGGEAFVSRGGAAAIIGLSGDIERFAATLNLVGLPGVADVVRTSAPYKLVSREHRRRRSVIRVAGVPIGPDTLTVIAGPCAVETPEQTLAAARMARAGGRVAAARRRVQAALFAVRVPGTRRGGPEDPGRRAGRGRAADRDRGGRRARRRPGRLLRRHAPGRHPQHAELPAAAGGRRGRQAGHAQARHVRHHRGVADGGRVHRPARQPGHRAVRARHPHLREGHQEHARHLGRAGRAAAVAPAGDRGPVALRRPPRPGAAAVPGGDRGRRGRHHHRRPPAPGVRAMRRPAGAHRIGPAGTRQHGDPPVPAGRPDPHPGPGAGPARLAPAPGRTA